MQHGNTERTLTEMEILYTKQCKTTAYLPYYTNLYAHELTGYTIEGDGMIHKPENVGHVPVYAVKVKGEDVLENFLFDSKKSFCIHYASTATLLLRRLGVPARYVTGYAVDPGEFVKNPDGTYTAVVPDESGHAWVEVFFEER